MPLLRFKRGALASLPTLYAGEPAITTDTGTERLYVGTPSGNVRFARYDEILGAIPDATALLRGAVSIGTQEFAGVKRFGDGIEAGNPVGVTGNVVLYNESDSFTNTLLAPAGGLTASRQHTFPDATGTIALTSDILNPVIGCWINSAVTAGATRYTAPFDTTVSSGADTSRFYVPSGKVIRNLTVAAKGAGTGTLTLTVRTKAGNSTLTAAASYTASFGAIASDTTHTVTTSTDDFISFEVVAATNNCSQFSIYVEIGY